MAGQASFKIPNVYVCVFKSDYSVNSASKDYMKETVQHIILNIINSPNYHTKKSEKRRTRKTKLPFSKNDAHWCVGIRFFWKQYFYNFIIKLL